MLHLAIDPGINQIGFSIFFNGKLWSAGLIICKTKGKDYARAEAIANIVVGFLLDAGYDYFDSIAIEDQIIRNTFTARGVLLLSLAARKIEEKLDIAFGSRVTRYLPEAWKGGMGKQATEVHMLRRLTEQEKSEITPQRGEAECWKHWLLIPFRKRTETQAKAVSDVVDGICIGLKHAGRF